MSSRQEYCKAGAKSRSSNQHLLFILFFSGIPSRTTKIWLTSKYLILWFNSLSKDTLGWCDFAERKGCNSELSTLWLLFSMSRQLWDTTIVSFSYNNLVWWIDCGFFFTSGWHCVSSLCSKDYWEHCGDQHRHVSGNDWCRECRNWFIGLDFIIYMQTDHSVCTVIVRTVFWAGR